MPTAETPHAPLLATASRLGSFDVGLPPGVGWHPLASATDPAWMASLVDTMARGGPQGPRPRSVAGAYVGGAVAWSVLQPLAGALVVDRRALDVAVPNAALFVDEEGWATRLALVDARFAGLPDDPAAGSAGVEVVADEAALVGWAADRVVATFTPVFAALRAVSPYGTSGLWGALADSVSGVLWSLHEGGAGASELDAAWTRTEALVDALQRRVPALKARSRRFTIGGPTGPLALPLRSTCCLYYRTPESLVDGTDGMCTTCPRRSDTERVALVAERLEAEAG